MFFRVSTVFLLVSLGQALAAVSKFPGTATTILEFQTKSGSITFNDKSLKEILSHKEVVGRKIAVVSVMGAYSKNKNVLLDYFLRFMYTNYRSVGSPSKPLRSGSKKDWLGDPSEPTQGFSRNSSSGRRLNKASMIVWSDVFLAEEADGEKVAIILMDAQWFSDKRMLTTDNARLASLNSLLSSMQIFNSFKVINDDQLAYLRFSTEYAKYAQLNNEMKSHSKSFQNLMFLIRDLSDDHKFGYEGGEEFLKQVLTIEKTQKPELKTLRQNLYSTFDNVTCFLMPQLGTKIEKDNDFDGRWSKLDAEFLDHLQVLVNNILTVDSLAVKKVYEEPLYAEEYAEFVGQYVDLFKTSKLPELGVVHEITVENHMQILIAKYMAIYENDIEMAKSTLRSSNQLDQVHKTAKENAARNFLGEIKMGTKDQAQEYKEILEVNLELLFAEWKVGAKETIDQWLEVDLKNREELIAKQVEEELAAETKRRDDEEKNRADELLRRKTEAVLRAEELVRRDDEEIKRAAEVAVRDAEEKKRRDEELIRRSEEQKRRDLELTRRKEELERRDLELKAREEELLRRQAVEDLRIAEEKVRQQDEISRKSAAEPAKVDEEEYEYEE